jgi:predicted nucleic acid-binding protein
VIVVDASVLANVVGDDGADGDLARAALAGQDVSVPDLVDVEVVSVLRRRWLAKTMTARRARSIRMRGRAVAAGPVAAVQTAPALEICTVRGVRVRRRREFG